MNWIELKALHELARGESVKLNETLDKSTEIDYLCRQLHVLNKLPSKLIPHSGYPAVYERKFKTEYELCHHFLSEMDLLQPGARYEVKDIKTLIHVKTLMDNGDLDELRQQIIEFNTSLRNISLMFFKNEKYLLKKTGLIRSLKKILDVQEFSNEKDQQYIYKLECTDPIAIVLCENLDFLTKHNKPRKHQIELWYAGGKNVNKLEFSDSRGLPVFYCCDWDRDGLFVIYPLVKKFIPGIRLLYPTGEPVSIQTTEHASHWDKIIPPDLAHLFNSTEQTMINQLIINDCWIVEESNDLIKMLGIN